MPRAREKLKLNSLQPVMSDSLGNYEPQNLPPRSGPGEGGKTLVDDEDKKSLLCSTGVPVILSPEEEEEARPAIARYGFNMLASDKISLDRRIKDTRPDEQEEYSRSTKKQFLVFLGVKTGSILM